MYAIEHKGYFVISQAILLSLENLTAVKHTKSLSYNKRYCVIDGQLRTLFLYSKTYH